MKEYSSRIYYNKNHDHSNKIEIILTVKNLMHNHVPVKDNVEELVLYCIDGTMNFLSFSPIPNLFMDIIYHLTTVSEDELLLVTL